MAALNTGRIPDRSDRRHVRKMRWKRRRGSAERYIACPSSYVAQQPESAKSHLVSYEHPYSVSEGLDQ